MCTALRHFVVLLVLVAAPLAHADEAAPADLGWATAHGTLTSVYLGFDTEEGDHCSFALDAASGVVSTGNSVWSGFPCPWPTGSRHVPVDDSLRRAIRDAISAPDALIRLDDPPSRPEPLGHFEEQRVVTTAGVFAPSMQATAAIDAAGRALMTPWVKRDLADGLDGLIVTWVRDGQQIRLLGEKHGVLWETRSKDGASTGVRLRSLNTGQRVRLLQLLAAVRPVESVSSGAPRDVFVRFAEHPTSVVAPLPKPVRALLDFFEE